MNDKVCWVKLQVEDHRNTVDLLASYIIESIYVTHKSWKTINE